MIHKAIKSGQKLLTNKLFLSSSFISAITFSTGIVNLLFQMIITRIISDKDYGIFIPLISLSMVIALPAGALQIVMSKDLTLMIHQNKFSTMKKYLKMMFLIILSMSGILLIGLILSLPILRLNLHIENNTAFYIIFIKLLVDLMIIPFNSFVQARERFHIYGLYALLGTALKFLAGIGIAYLLMSYIGGLLGVVLSVVGCFIFVLIDFMRYKDLFKPDQSPVDTGYLDLKRIVKSFIHVFITIGAFQFITQLDVLLVRKYLVDQAHIYSSIIVLGKASSFLAAAMSVVLLPFMAKNKDSMHRSNTFALLILMGVLVCYGIGLSIFSGFIGNILFAGKFPGMEKILPLFGFMVLPYSAVTFMVTYYVVSEKIFYPIVIIIGAILETIGVMVFHEDLIQVSIVVGVVGYLILIALFLDSVIFHKAKIKAEEKAEETALIS